MQRRDSIMVPPAWALGIGTALVAASTAGLPLVRGYGTELFQIVALTAWALVAAIASGAYADTHHGAVWTCAIATNAAAFLSVALPFYYISRRRWPRAATAALLVWTVVYLMCLFVMFPATDGP